MTDVKEPQPVYTAQPTAPAQPSYRVTTGSEEWQHNIFDCFEGADNLCLKGTFCPCFVYGKTQARLRDPTLQGYDRFNNDCIMWGGIQYCCGLGWVLQFIKRGELRQQYSLKGDTLTDCLYSAFCHCCALIQQEKEVISRQEQAGLIQQQGYVAPPAGMVVEPKPQ